LLALLEVHVSRSIFSRLLVFVAALALATTTCAYADSNALEMSAGLRHIEASAPIEDCYAKAKSALSDNLQNPASANGIWLAYGPVDSAGRASAAAVIHCYPVGTGYVVTFTCSVQSPPNRFSADDLCQRVNASFLGKAAAPLATPTPQPSGCSTTNLVGTWTLDDKGGVPFVFDVNGGLLDNEGVSGNWALDGNKVSLVYYGTTTLTLSPDGKHLMAPKGTPRNFTRKC
jgi:hypothetical protein